MELKEMADTGVVVTCSEEIDELRSYCKSSNILISSVYPYREIAEDRGDVYILVNGTQGSWYVSDNHNNRNLITLAQFKKEQGIMKYKKDDVLENSNGNKIVILAVCGSVYFPSERDEFEKCSAWPKTEKQIKDKGYTLKTDEPELTTLTMEDVAKLAGIGVDSLRIEK